MSPLHKPRAPVVSWLVVAVLVGTCLWSCAAERVGITLVSGEANERISRVPVVDDTLVEVGEKSLDPSQPHVKEYAKLEMEAEIRAAMNGTDEETADKEKVVDDVLRYSPRYKYRAEVPDKPPPEVKSDNIKLPNCTLPGCGVPWDQFETALKQNETAALIGEDADGGDGGGNLPSFDDGFHGKHDMPEGTFVVPDDSPNRDGKSPFSHFFDWYHCGSCSNGQCPKHCSGKKPNQGPSGNCAGQCNDLCGVGAWESGCMKDCLEDCQLQEGGPSGTKDEIFRLEQEIRHSQGGGRDMCPTNGDTNGGASDKCVRGGQAGDHLRGSSKPDLGAAVSDLDAASDEAAEDADQDESMQHHERMEDDKMAVAVTHLEDDESGIAVHNVDSPGIGHSITDVEREITSLTKNPTGVDGSPDDASADPAAYGEATKAVAAAERAVAKGEKKTPHHHGHGRKEDGGDRKRHHPTGRTARRDDGDSRSDRAAERSDDDSKSAGMDEKHGERDDGGDGDGGDKDPGGGDGDTRRDDSGGGGGRRNRRRRGESAGRHHGGEEERHRKRAPSRRHHHRDQQQ